jgi:hypothetical protein
MILTRSFLLFLSLLKVAERQWLWEATCAAKGNKETQDEAKQALDKARAHRSEIVQQRTIDARRGEMLLGQKTFEEVSRRVPRLLYSDPNADITCSYRRRLC